MKPYSPRFLPIDDLDWVSLIPQIGEANAAVARYDGLLQSIVNPVVLLSPLTTQEAVLSSRIEGTQATLREVLAYEAEPNLTESVRYADIQEVINYRKARAFAVNEIKERPITLNLLKRIHNILLDSVRGRYKGRGRIRTQQNYIGAPGGIENASYVPPEPQALQFLLDNLEQYIHSEEKDKLVQSALIHAQFELIHPFLDGNGRVGRILIPLFLYEKKLLSSPMLYISAYLEAHRQEYYTHLRNISTDGAYDAWVRFFLNAVTTQALKDAHKARAIHELYEKTKVFLTSNLRSKYNIQVLDALFVHPVFASSRFLEHTTASRRSAQRILQTLQEEGIVLAIREGHGRQPTIFVFDKLLTITEGI